MRAVVHALSALLARLNPREQKLITLFAVLVVLSTVWFAILHPFLEQRAQMARSVAILSEDLGTMMELAANIKSLEASSLTASSTAEEDFSLFSIVDQVTSSTLRRESIEYMNPSRRRFSDGSEESLVELKLSGVSFVEVVEVLRGLERGSERVYVKELDLRRRYNDRERFDVVVLAGAMVGT
ncbi:MAG: type II secretion system protein GspM [Candidatus Binatia bacterium]